MASIELGETLKSLKAAQAKMHEHLAKLDQAIAVLKGLSAASATPPDKRVGKRTMSAAGRRRIAKAQKLRWAKVKQAKAPQKSGTSGTGPRFK